MATLPAAAAALAAAGWAWHGRPPAEALLAWDGQRWSADGATGELDVMIDLDRWLLLRLRGSNAARWIAVSSAAAGPAWHALRVAAFATPAAAADEGKGGGDDAGAGNGDPDRPTMQAAAR